MKVDLNLLKESIENLKKADTYIEVKEIDTVKNHDGSGSKYIFFFQPKNVENGFFFIAETDFWSGYEIINSPIVDIELTEFRKINKKNIVKIMDAKYNLIRKDIEKYRFIQSQFEQMEKDIKNIPLDINGFSGENCWDDALSTLITQNSDNSPP